MTSTDDDWVEILGAQSWPIFVTSSGTASVATRTITFSTGASATVGNGLHLNICCGTDNEILGSVFVNGMIGSGISYVRPRLEDRQPTPLNHKGAPLRSVRRGTQFSDADAAEMLALQLLRKMVSHEDFRRYLRHGFVAVRGHSGLVYQIDRVNRIKVWDKSERIAELCVHVRGEAAARRIPPTDEVVGKMLIVECDEADIWKRSNATWCTDRRDRPALVALGVGSTARSGQGNINIHINNEGNIVGSGFARAAGRI